MSEFGGLWKQTTSLHCSLDNATVTAGFPQGKQPEFPMGEVPFGQYSCEKQNGLKVWICR